MRQRADTDVPSPLLTSEQFQELADRISNATGPSVLLVPDGTDVRVLSYY